MPAMGKYQSRVFYLTFIPMLGSGCDVDQDSDSHTSGVVQETSEELSFRHDQRRRSKIRVENQVSLGEGHLRTVYSVERDGTPRMIGLSISEAAMQSLPTTPTHDGNTCFDVNEDGVVDPATECKGGHERVLWFPKIDGLPFQWLMFNWQPHGHGPTHVFDEPHFDVHFFIQDYHERNAIRTGPCGGAVIHCDDNETALIPVPAPYNPKGFGLPGAAARMGNHLADLNAPPVNGGPFEDAFVYGTYGGHVTFWETVYNVNWLADEKPENRCIDIKWAPEVEQSGYYPAKTCVNYRHRHKDYLFSLEDFVWRSAPAR